MIFLGLLKSVYLPNPSGIQATNEATTFFPFKIARYSMSATAFNLISGKRGSSLPVCVFDSAAFNGYEGGVNESDVRTTFFFKLLKVSTGLAFTRQS
jgi:hypothetical protein